MSTYTTIHTDFIPECVHDEIETMVMCMEFGQSSLKAETDGQCCLNKNNWNVMDKAVKHWATESTECIAFLRKAYDIKQSSVVMFAGVHHIQCQWYGVFAFSNSLSQYYSGHGVWVIYFHLRKGLLFMCYQPKMEGRGSYW